MRLTRSRRERGTVAVVVALSATMIFALCALGVDLGSAFARKRDIQTQADLATLAAAAELPYSASSKAAIELAATKYATSNEVAGQAIATWNFGDADQTNGFIEYIGRNKLRLFAPQSSVDFWLAPVAGLPDGMEVSAVAAAEIRSPGTALPFFVSNTCGWNLQTILDATSGPSIPPGYVPSLTPTSSPTSSLDIESVTSVPSPVPYPPSAPIALTITLGPGDKFDDVERVGFTTESGLHFTQEVTLTGGTALVTVPGTSFTAEDIWWVRLLEDGKKDEDPSLWTASSGAYPLVVGDVESPTTGTCDSKKAGNFGSLALSRSVGVPSTYLVENMAQGVEHGFDYYPTPVPVPPDNCAGKAEAVTDSGTPDSDRLLNCLVTDTGSDLAQKATAAFIVGTSAGSDPRLSAAKSPTKAGCGTSNHTYDEISGDPVVNNDLLTCFITGTHRVGDVTKPGVVPVAALSADIFESPRFFWIPVLVSDPSGGGAGSYAVVDFRPVFITSQVDAATRANPLNTATDNPGNGIIMSSNGKQIEKIKVRAINPTALPGFSPDLGDRTIDYVGVGTKIVRLVE